MKIFLKTKGFDDSDVSLDVVKVGQEFCSPRKPIVNCVRPCYSLHFVTYGKGYLITEDGQKYNINRGDAFLLYQGEQYRYYPDVKDPWSYMWIEFTGEKLDGMMSLCGFERNAVCKHVKDFPVFHEYMRNAYEMYDASEVQQLRCNAYFMLIAGKFIEQESESKTTKKAIYKRKQLREILIYINNNLSADLTLQLIAQVNGISLSSLNTLFNELLGMPPIDYINSFRVATACEYFHYTDTSVRDVASIVGFGDEKYFSRVFSEIKGMSPQVYKKSGVNEDPFAWIKEKGMLFR